MNKSVTGYFLDGCGRCPLGGTPQCKVHRWSKELAALRKVLLSCNLMEEVKWGVPCYTDNHKNIVLMSAFKEYCAVSFFKGALLKDEDKFLEKPGENSQAARIMRFTTVADIKKSTPKLKRLVQEAIDLERKGLKVDFKAKTKLVLIPELLKKFKELPALETAFQKLTPGRQRGYMLYFSQPKQSQTREQRINKCAQLIFEGRGWNDEYMANRG